MRIPRQTGDITQGVIWKQLLYFFFPLWFGTFFQQLYNTVDTVVVGRFVGTTALAAVGSTGVVANLTVGIFTGLSSGAVVAIAQRYGARQDEEVRKSVHTAMLLSLLIGAFFPWMTAADQGLAWRDEKHWLWATREAWGSDACADVGSLSQLAGQLQVPLRLCIDAGDEASRFDVWQVIHRRQPPLPADGDRYAIALGLALGGGRNDACR